MDEINLLKKSLENIGLSSRINVVEESIKAESQPFISEEITIPERYNETKVVFLPVDPWNHYVYWDIEDGLYNQIKDKEILIKVICCGEEKLKIPVKELSGNYYFSFHAPFKEVYCRIGYSENEKFITITESNRFILPSDQIFEGKTYFVNKEELRNRKDIKQLLEEIEKTSKPLDKKEIVRNLIPGSSELL